MRQTGLLLAYVGGRWGGHTGLSHSDTSDTQIGYDARRHTKAKSAEFPQERNAKHWVGCHVISLAVSGRVEVSSKEVTTYPLSTLRQFSPLFNDSSNEKARAAIQYELRTQYSNIKKGHSGQNQQPRITPMLVICYYGPIRYYCLLLFILFIFLFFFYSAFTLCQFIVVPSNLLSKLQC